MSRTLPSKGNLENIEKEARVLLHDLRRGDPATIRRFYLLDFEAPTLVTGLGDAQYLIAREYGCKSWRELKERLIAQRVKT